ncbi:MAG TPA: hypothetical protein VMY06_02845 [Sedimentisphaerales bacterium]|nr:hypothetical protein [Sedimentisphaerales bacterium]
MITGKTEVIGDKQIHLLDELQSLLEKQIELARQGNAAGRRIEVLSKQADSLAGKIVQSGILESTEFENRREHLKKLYDTLRLAIETQKADVSEKLNQVRKGKKTVQTYHSHIRYI